MSKSLLIEYISRHREQWPVVLQCKVLGVSESGYYKHQRHADRPYRHSHLLAQIKQCITEDPENANYGVQRITLWLKQRVGYTGSERTIRRVCKENGLMIRPKRKPNGITKADRKAEKSENLIKQDFTAEMPNKKWLTDITEIPCKDGKIYLAPVLDCYDGCIIGYKIKDSMHAELCVEAFELACRRTGARGMILHSDRGSQYTSRVFRASLLKHDAIQSMSGTGRCYDNARMESFFATLKKEKLYRIQTSALSKAEVSSIVVRYIAYYNLRRIYTTNHGWPPSVWRQMYYSEATAA